MFVEEEQVFNPHQTTLRVPLVSTIRKHIHNHYWLTPAATMEKNPQNAREARYDLNVVAAAFQIPPPMARVWKMNRIGKRPK